MEKKTRGKKANRASPTKQRKGNSRREKKIPAATRQNQGKREIPLSRQELEKNTSTLNYIKLWTAFSWGKKKKARRERE